MKTPPTFSLDYKYILNDGSIIAEGIDLVIARIDKLFIELLKGVRLQQGDTLNLRYKLTIPPDPHLPRMPFWKRIRWWYRRQVNLFKGWLCKCT